MNPLFVVPLLAYTLAATLWPAQVDGHRRAATLLLWEAVFVIIALVAGTYFARLAKCSSQSCAERTNTRPRASSIPSVIVWATYSVPGPNR